MQKYLLPLILLAIPVCNCLPLNAVPIAANRIASQERGKTIATIQGKDLVHPTLSPDGKFLAYSEVIVVNKRENTAVRILNLATKQSFLLISPQVAAKYRTYSSFVSSMDWTRFDRLEVTIGDGDVGSSILTFEPFGKKLLSVRHEEGSGFSPAAERLRKKIIARFPKVKSENLTKIMLQRQLVETPTTVMLTGKILDRREDNLWLLDFQNSKIASLFDATDPLAKAKIESSKVTGNGSILLVLVTDDDRKFLVTYQHGKIARRQPLPQVEGRTKIIHATNNKIWMMAYVYNTYEQGNNPLYLWENGKLRKSTDYERLYDARVNSQGTRIAYCYWIDGKRQISVKELF
jgi:hypothetical protein